MSRLAIKVQGFTLLEILIAMAVFSLIGLASAQVLYSVLASDEISQTAAKGLTKIQRSYQIIQRDMMQMAPRGLRVNGEAPQKTYLLAGDSVLDSSDEGIAFSRLGWRNPAQMFPRGTSQAVGYRLFDNKLQRLHFLYPDQGAGVEPQIVELMENVEQLKFEYFSQKKWQTKWQGHGLPQGIAMIVTTQKHGELRWQFLVPGAVISASPTGGQK